MPVITGFQKGIDAAVKYLLGTAEDYEEMSIQETRAAAQKRPLYAPGHQQRAQAFSDKAKLLRGQAAHISTIKE